MPSDTAQVKKADTGPLSEREAECLQFASLGKTSGEIGIILGISTFTVNNHFASAMKKLSVMNRVHAVALALRSGWI